MKLFLALFLVLFSCLGFSQEEEKSIYFPQEMLVHPDCVDLENKGSCLKNILQQDLSVLINKGIVYPLNVH